jgi:AcrR family transcriptional regulator
VSASSRETPRLDSAARAERPGLRADAERNRQAVIDAAAAVFAEQGTDAALDVVARRAGVGIATLYRRFPTRDLLVEAVLDDKMRRYADDSEEAAERALTKPWDAFAGYVESVLALQAQDPAFADMLLAPFHGSPVFAEEHARAFRASVRLVERARLAGAIRPDFQHVDLYLAVLAGDGVSRATRDHGAQSSRRLAAYLLDAFRADAGHRRLPAVPYGLRPSR